MKKLIAAAALALCFSAHADDLQGRALAGQAGDVVTTAVALSIGLAEGNPLGILAVVGKVVILKHADGLPPGPDRDEWHRVMSAFGWGATVNNGCWGLAALTGGGFGPVCLPLGIVTWVVDRHITADMVDVRGEDVYMGAQ